MRIRASYIAGLFTIIFVVLFGYALMQLLQLNTGLRREIDDSKLWISGQASLEAQRMLLAVEQADRDGPQAHGADGLTHLQLRYDILYSRVDLMKQPALRDYFLQFKEDEPIMTRISRDMGSLEEMVFLPSEQIPLERLREAAIKVSDDLQGVNVSTALEQRVSQFQRRDIEQRMIEIALVAICGIFVTVMAMVALLWRNLRRLQRAKHDLEDHRRELEGRVEQRTRELALALDVERRARAAYQSFVVTVSHQFRTPISIIHMIAQRQLRSAELSPTDVLRRKFATIMESTDRLERIVSGFLTQASIETYDETPPKRAIDIRDVIDAAVTDAKRQYPDRVIVTTHSGGDMVVDGDPQGLEQAVLNLLINALKYSDAPDPVMVDSWDVGSRKFVKVSDTGMGIPVDAQPAIFDRFYRAANVHRLPGVGVGLGRVREIIMQHDGDVEFTSDEGVGSSFTLVLPAKGMKLNDPQSCAGDDPLHRG